MAQNPTSQTILDPKERFLFGENWSIFLNSLDDERIQEAVGSLQKN